MKLEIDIPEHQYNNIMAIDSMSLGRAQYKGIIMYAINAIKRGKVLEQEPTTKNLAADREDAVERLNAIKQLIGYDKDSEIVKATQKSLDMAIKALEQEPRWIPVSERLPETDNKNSINNYNVLLWVKDKKDPEDEPQIYLGKLRKVNGDDGSHNFWGIKTEPCDWTIWGWSYFHEPEVIAWMPLPQSYKVESEEE